MNNMKDMMGTNKGILESESAIVVKNASFGYKKNVNVLNQLDLTVKKGEIFALLGPNGVGKTTIIRAILGRIKLKCGSINVFGQMAGSPLSDIPGPGAGYMPQELALFEEFTIQQILNYYGMIYHLKAQHIANRIDELIQILNLPEKERLISRLSGGQKRRVSIAITMIHKPKLIILDEPTVGVDSLLRRKIWNYLQDMSNKYGLTTIITTHYIEEARNADTVAFMNYGKILLQTNPELVLQEYNSPTLENVFLILCQNDQFKSRSLAFESDQNTNHGHVNNYKNLDGKKEASNYEQSRLPRLRKFISIDTRRVKAMSIKFYLTTLGRPMYLLIYFMLIPLTLFLTKYTTGNTPTDNPIALYNADSGSQLSQLFMDSLDTKTLKIIEFSNNETAFDSVVKGQNILSVVIPKNFSDNFEYLIRDPLQMSDEELEGSRLHISLDSTNVAVSYFIQAELLQAMFKFFVKASIQLVGHDMTDYLNMVKIEHNLHGNLDMQFDVFMVTGLLVVNVFGLQLISSSVQLLEDKKSSSFGRMFVAGVTPSEFLLAQLINNIVLTLLVLIAIMFVAFYIFGYPFEGNYLIGYGLLFMVSLEGMGIGIMMGVVTDTFVSGGLISAATFITLTLTSGIFWPVQAIPWYFAFVAKLNPITNVNLALQAVSYRGWSISSPVVLYGFLTCAIYSLVSIVISYLLLKFKPKD